jgi:hypothetical protein
MSTQDSLPTTDNVEQNDDWVAWGHADTRTRTHSGKHHHRHRSSGHGHTHGTGRNSSRGGGHRHHRRKRHTGRIVAIVVAVVLVLVLVPGGLFAYSAYGVMNNGRAAMAEVSTFQAALTKGDASAAQQSAKAIQTKAAAIKSEVDGPLWTVAGFIPVVGQDIRNARTIGDAVDNLATNALVPLSEQAGTFSLHGVMSNGTINVQALDQVATAVSTAAPALEQSAAALDAMPQGSIAQVNQIADKATDTVDSLNSLCGGLSKVAPYLTDMLGADGTRTYIIVAQNNVEIKPSGGFMGSWGTVTLNNGKVELGKFDSFNSGILKTRLSDVTDEEKALFVEGSYGIWPGDSGVNPDFERAGYIASRMWEVNGRGKVDGVIAVDPYMLQSLLKLVGGVTLPDGTQVDGNNCVQVIEHDVYWKYLSKANQTATSGDQADAAFSAIASLAFDKVIDNIGSVEMTSLADTLAQDTEDHRIQIWMADGDEEAAMKALGVSGALSTDAANPELGVFMQNIIASKMDWWQNSSTSYQKNGNSYTVTTTVKNDITQKEIDEASDYIVGNLQPFKRGTIHESVFLYAPAGGSIDNVQITGEGTDNGAFTIDGHNVRSTTITAEPGATTTITYTVTVSPQATSDLKVRTTPMIERN